MITIVTNFGDIAVELFEETAPISSANFKQYALVMFGQGVEFLAGQALHR